MTLRVLIKNIDTGSPHVGVVKRGEQELFTLAAGEEKEATIWRDGGELTISELPPKPDNE